MKTRREKIMRLSELAWRSAPWQTRSYMMQRAALIFENKTHCGSGQHLKEREGKEEKRRQKGGSVQQNLEAACKDCAGEEAEEDSGKEECIILLQE